MTDAKPLYFGKLGDLFGWYHAASSNSHGLGVVIVSPNGFDMISMHWGLRLFAQKVAASGMPVVRFDLHGTGDSLGDDTDPGRVAAWTASIHDAIDLLKAQANVARIVLVGVRLGGTLAAGVATLRHDVDGLMLYCPCSSGRQYVRELRVLAAAVRGVENIDADDLGPDDVQMAGWLLTGQTVTELAKLDISKLSYNNKRVLYMHRDDLGADQKLINALQSSASHVAVRASAEFAQFSQDALLGKEPVADFNYMCGWLQSMPRSVRGADNNVVATAVTCNSELRGTGFSEEPVRFGNGVSMFGILCKPDEVRSRLCVVIVNTGAIHHIGSQRMTVEHARKFAALGITSLRIDISGVGDSEVRPGNELNQVYNLPAADDVTEAIDFLQSRGFGEIVLCGICSGAYLAYNAAVKDQRVKSLCVTNLLRFIWREGDTLEGGNNISAASLESYVQKLHQWETWRRLFKGGINLKYLSRAISSRLMQGVKGRAGGLIYRLRHPGEGANPVHRNCLNMLKRGALIVVTYSAGDGGMDEVALYLGSRGKLLKNYPGFSFHEIAGADHTLTTRKSRNALFDIYVGSIRKRDTG